MLAVLKGSSSDPEKLLDSYNEEVQYAIFVKYKLTTNISNRGNHKLEQQFNLPAVRQKLDYKEMPLLLQ